MFEIVGKRRYKSIDDKGDDITNIFLPIATHKLLLGTAFSTIPQISFKSINKAMPDVAMSISSAPNLHPTKSLLSL